MNRRNLIIRTLFICIFILLISNSASASLYTISTLNNTNIVWGDFHIQINPVLGSDISNVDFLSGTMTQPASSQSPFTWQIDNINKTLDYYFYADPVFTGETCSFSFYVNNPSAVQFGFSFYPTPVPEPSTMLLIGGGLFGIGVLRRKLKK